MVFILKKGTQKLAKDLSFFLVILVLMIGVLASRVDSVSDAVLNVPGNGPFAVFMRALCIVFLRLLLLLITMIICLMIGVLMWNIFNAS